MAVAISASLEAHQKGAATKPALKVRVGRLRGEYDIPRWVRDEDGGTVVTPGKMSAVIADDGSLNWLRSDTGDVFHRRVVVPEPGATWDPAATVLEATPVSYSDVAIAASASEVIALYIDATGLRARSSSDDGATFAAEVTVTAGYFPAWFDVAFNAAGNPVVFASVGDNTLYTIERSAGVWGTPALWADHASWHTTAGVTGIAVVHGGGDFQVVVAGARPAAIGGWQVYGYVFGDTVLPADTWFGPKEIQLADGASGVTLERPQLTLVGSGELWLSWRHVQTADVAHSRIYVTHGNTDVGALGDWMEPAPFDFDGDQTGAGLALAASGDYLYGVSPRGVWLSERSAGMEDVSTRVRACRCRVGADGGALTVELGGLTLPGELVPGGLVEVSVGYQPGAAGAAEYGLVVEMVVDEWWRTWAKGEGGVTIKGHSLWEELDRQRMPVGWSVASGAASRAELHSRVVGRAGFGSGEDGPAVSAHWAGYAPAFSVLASETVGGALRRLMAVVPDHLRHETTASLVQGVDDGQTADWALGGSGEHPVMEGSVIEGRPRSGWERVQGDAVVADSHDFVAIGRGAGFRYLRNVEANTDQRATDWVEGLRRRSAVGEETMEVVVPAHAGVQLFDVLEVTVGALGVSGELHRVVAWELTMALPRKGERGEAVYRHRLRLGVV